MVEYSHDWKSEKLRLVLKKSLLEEIIKTNCDRNLYSVCLDETNAALNNWGQVDTGYSCCIPGCRFNCERHRHYITHLRKNHSSLKDVPCNFEKNCKQNFSSLESLVQHIKDSHSSTPASVLIPSTSSSSLINIPCKCDLCSGRNFENITELMRHYNAFHSNQNRECIFLGCKVSFGPSSTSRHHFRLKHKHTGNMTLKAKHLVNVDQYVAETIESSDSSVAPISGVPAVVSDSSEIYDLADIDALENSTEEIAEDLDEDYFLEYYSDFLNRLSNFKFIPNSSVQEIAEEYIMNTRKSLESRKSLLKKSLDGLTNISQEEKNRILSELEDDTFLSAQIKLGTEYKRSKFVKENPSFVEPEEIILNREEVRLGGKKECYHYIPIVSTFKALLQDVSFNKMMDLNKDQTSDDKIIDMKDGSIYKRSDYFQSNPDAYSILMYSDAVELKNPLGAARGVYKIVQVFYTLADIPKAQRSQVDRLQLVMVFREKLLQKHSLQTIYKRLVADLKSLETGIIISFPMTRRVKAGVLCYAADNLEASVVGGFSACFSSKDICRTCHIQHKDLETHISDYDGSSPHSYWSETEYDAIVQSLNVDADEEVENEASQSEEDEHSGESEGAASDISDSVSDGELSDGEDNIVDKHGVKSNCPLNVLESFHRNELKCGYCP